MRSPLWTLFTCAALCAGWVSSSAIAQEVHDDGAADSGAVSDGAVEHGGSHPGVIDDGNVHGGVVHDGSGYDGGSCAMASAPEGPAENAQAASAAPVVAVPVPWAALCVRVGACGIPGCTGGIGCHHPDRHHCKKCCMKGAQTRTAPRSNATLAWQLL